MKVSVRAPYENGDLKYIYIYAHEDATKKRVPLLELSESNLIVKPSTDSVHGGLTTQLLYLRLHSLKVPMLQQQLSQLFTSGVGIWRLYLHIE